MLSKELLLLTIMVCLVSCSPKFMDANGREQAQNNVLNVKPGKGQKVDSLLRRFDNMEMPGLSVAVTEGDSVLFLKGYGSANLEHGIPITKNTVFQIASVSKQFTAFAIALLQDRGKLSLDDDIRTYLPEIPDLGTPITIRHLLHHTSGLRDQLWALGGWREDDVKTEGQFMKLVERQTSLNFAPGEEFLYCNTGYNLLAKIVERVTQVGFASWTKEHILDPLDMEASIFLEDHRNIVPDKADSYRKKGDGYKKAVSNISYMGATNLYTTAEDLARWAINFNTHEIGNAAVMERMHQKGRLNNGETVPYSLGQMHRQHKGTKMIVHSGSLAGYLSYLARFPEQGYTVVLLSNNANINPEKTALAIADIYLGEKTDQVNTPPTPMEMDAYTGRYKLREKVILEIWEGEGVLKGRILGKNDIHELRPRSVSEFTLPTLNNALISFGLKEDGMVESLVFKSGTKSVHARKMESVELDKVPLEEYEGRYQFMKNLVFNIWAENDTLKGRITGKRDTHSFRPVSQSEFTLPTLNNASVTFERNVDKVVDRLVYKDGQRSVAASKKERFDPKNIDLGEYAGTYFSRELTTFYTLALEDQGLVARSKRLDDIHLVLEAPDFFTGDQWFFKHTEVVRDTDGDIIGILVSSTRARNQLFKKIKKQPL